MTAPCFFCGLEHPEGHPTCDNPACDTPVHGYGSEGKTTRSYCSGCRGGDA
jgi:hypothetical protein